jgi:hypothetical protein
MNEPMEMREIHKIREQSSREKKSLSLKERVAYANRNIDELKKYGINVKQF